MERKETVLTTLVVVLDKTHEKILLVNRQKPTWKGWAAPGGHVDFPESFYDCAAREVKEETGLRVKKLRSIGLSHFVGLDNGEDYVVVNFMTDQTEGELHPARGEAECRWFQISELGDIPLAHDFMPTVLNALAGRAVERFWAWDDSGKEEYREYKL